MHFPNGPFRQSDAHIVVPRYKNRNRDKTTSLDSEPVQTSSTKREREREASTNGPAAAQTCPDPGFDQSRWSDWDKTTEGTGFQCNSDYSRSIKAFQTKRSQLPKLGPQTDINRRLQRFTQKKKKKKTNSNDKMPIIRPPRSYILKISGYPNPHVVHQINDQALKDGSNL